MTIQDLKEIDTEGMIATIEALPTFDEQALIVENMKKIHEAVQNIPEVQTES